LGGAQIEHGEGLHRPEKFSGAVFRFRHNRGRYTAIDRVAAEVHALYC